MRHLPLLSLTVLCVVLASSDGQREPYRRLDPSELARISSALAKAEPRQMGILGFAALGAMMFPILVSLGMASFVSHLPTVFKEFASEFGIPSTPPRNFYFYRTRRALDDRWHYVLRESFPLLVKSLEDSDVIHKNLRRR